MKSISISVGTVFLIAVAPVFSVLSVPAEANTQGRCSGVPGSWAWDTRGFYATIYSDGRVVGNDQGKRVDASWVCTHPGRGSISVFWNTGHNNYLTLSSDRRSLKGVSEHPRSEAQSSLLVIRR